MFLSENFVLILIHFSQGCLEKFPSILSVKDHLKICEKAVSHKCLACGKVFTGWMVAQNHVKHWHVGYAVTAFLYSREVLNNREVKQRPF